MADKTIGELKKATNLDDDSLMIAEQQGDAVSVTGALFKSFAQEATKGFAESASKDAATAVGAKDAAQSALQGVRDALDNLPAGDTLIINDLTTGGTAAALSAEMGKKLNDEKLNRSGDVMTGDLILQAQTPYTDAAGSSCGITMFDRNGTRYGYIRAIGSTDGDATMSIRNDLGSILLWPSNGVVQVFYNGEWMDILHTGNKPSGSYTGNATKQTIATGGIGDAVMIRHDGGIALVGYTGAIYAVGTTVTADVKTVFRSGVLTVGASSSINESGTTYHYQVL